MISLKRFFPHLPDKKIKEPPVLRIIDNTCRHRHEIAALKNQLNCDSASREGWYTKKLLNPSDKSRIFLHIWDDSPFSGEYLFNAERRGAKPGKEDFFFALEDGDYIRRNRSSFTDHMPQINGSFDDEATKEIRAGIPHVYVIPVDCMSFINEIMSAYIHDPAPSNARLKDLIVMFETATDIPHVQRQDP